MRPCGDAAQRRWELEYPRSELEIRMPRIPICGAFRPNRHFSVHSVSELCVLCRQKIGDQTRRWHESGRTLARRERSWNFARGDEAGAVPVRQAQIRVSEPETEDWSSVRTQTSKPGFTEARKGHERTENVRELCVRAPCPLRPKDRRPFAFSRRASTHAVARKPPGCPRGRRCGPSLD